MSTASNLGIGRPTSASRTSSVKRALRFVLVGTAGFLTDSGVFLLFAQLEATVTAARLASFSIAVCVTWLLNSKWTFRDRTSNQSSDFLKYLASQSLGSLVNLSTFFLSIQLSPPLQQIPVVAIAIASITAMTFNYLACHYIVFRRPPPQNNAASRGARRPRRSSAHKANLKRRKQ